MSAAPQVFVLVPSYNHAPFIERCLKSIIKQTYQPAKLLVIDDGSRDDSVKIIERVLRDCSFPAELIARGNKGLSATLNEGFAASFGKYFAYLGSDDIWLPQFLESRINLLEQKANAVLAFGHAFLIDENDRIIDCTKDWTQYADGDMLPYLLRGIVPASSSVLYRRSFLEHQRWNEDSILEDYEFYLRFSKRGEFALDSGVLSAWRQHGYNTSGDFAKMLREWLSAQTRTASELGISAAKLEQIQTKLKFNCAADFVRHGERRTAFRLWRENWRGAFSTFEIGKMLFRIMLPKLLLSWNKKRRRNTAKKRYEALKI